ncbi:undecaprenyl pyrophosphate synthase-like protein [Hapsidospora chrysogenum ATCC 11550]|uniref:ditrans,polycis-polyprenyl diphosphate synthase [(2E,6E)-farnesyldiphosphate specific] n=1 Tax=Hapsidospora chrysogenum (strain ATCC 11550 / CBS 779.69 / DSM 880 / IAM 14645 / JCM 23072 / IMI 49137) TaxID=857340 RepID=A0A086T570_HAPC1|nr:undecaprenyl pyrophosphate synthase-like protein [Hapsidospora chrysogenum ATCC 11550]
MPINVRDIKAYRKDEKAQHALLTDEEKRRIIQNSLPAPIEQPSVSGLSTKERRSRLGVRKFMLNQLHLLIFALMHGIFSLYIRIRQACNLVRYQISSILYYHHATPQYIQRDVTGLSKKPRHLSAVLRSESRRVAVDLDRLIDETAELATWCACAEIPMVSVYEKTGILKKHMPRIYEATTQKLAFYYGGEHPTLAVSSPHKDSYSSPDMDSNMGHLKLHLISAQDGRESVVDLTRTLAEMSQKGKLSPQDISMELIDNELSEGIMPEPDLLILFGPNVQLSNYPPWQIRLTEIFCLNDNESFGYQVFLKALRNYASAQMRRGK